MKIIITITAVSQIVLAEHKKCFTHLHTAITPKIIPLLFQGRQNLGKRSTPAENELANVGNYSRLDSPKQEVLVAQENVEFILKYLKRWHSVYLPFVV